MTLRNRLGRLFGRRRWIEAKRRKVAEDQHRIEVDAERVELGVSRMRVTVYERNHITEAVATVWGRRPE